MKNHKINWATKTASHYLRCTDFKLAKRSKSLIVSDDNTLNIARIFEDKSKKRRLKHIVDANRKLIILAPRLYRTAKYLQSPVRDERLAARQVLLEIVKEIEGSGWATALEAKNEQFYAIAQ